MRTESVEQQIVNLKNKEIEIYESYRNLPNGIERTTLWKKETKLMIERHGLIAKIS